jgi:hypothetical protein
VEAVVVVAQEFFRLELMLLEVLTQADQEVAAEVAVVALLTTMAHLQQETGQQERLEEWLCMLDNKE